VLYPLGMTSGFCPICREASVPFSEQGGRALLICGECRHIFWAVMPTAQEVADHYTRIYHGPVQAEHNLEHYAGHVQELAALAQRSVKDLRLADVGCSVPVFLKVAREAGAYHSVGVDFSEEAASAGAGWSVTVLKPDVFLAVTPDQSLDVLRYSHTLEHVIDPVRTLSEHAKKLRPGGVLYITQPSFPALRPEPANVELEDANWPEHLHFFSPLSVAKLVERSGCHVDRLFSADNENARAAKFFPFADVAYVASKRRDRGEAIFGALNNWPNYYGANVALYAVR